MYGYIYKTTNTVNGKIYIGQRKSSIFLAEDYLGSGVRLHSAIKHYGQDKFKVELVDTAESREELNQKEIHYISAFDARNPEVGYNLTIGGDGAVGNDPWNKGLTKEQDPRLIQTESEKLKRAESLKKAYKEGRHKINQPGYKHSHKQTEASRLANSQRQQGKRWMYIGDKDNPQHVTTVFANEIDTYLSKGYKFGRPNYKPVAWNKGLTSLTDERVRKYSEHRREQLKYQSIGFCKPKFLHKDTQ